MLEPTALTSLADLDQAITSSAAEPVLIFKHSATCGTSAYAHEEILEVIAGGHIPSRVYIVHVRACRAVSDAISARFGLRHESPQAILVHHGRVVWSATHYRVTAEAIVENLRKLTHAA